MSIIRVFLKKWKLEVDTSCSLKKNVQKLLRLIIPKNLSLNFKDDSLQTPRIHLWT